MLAIGVMIWLGSELMFFSGLFAAFFTIRANTVGPWPPAGTDLDTLRAGAFTVVLVLSSFTMQRAVFQLEWRKRRSARIWIVMTLILGVAFLGNQAYEWLFSPTRWYTNSYGSLFYIMSGLHGLHVFIGLVAMVFLLGRLRGDIGGDPGELSAFQGVSLLPALRRHRVGRALQLSVPSQVGMRGVRAPLKRKFRAQFLLPAGLLSVAAMASLAVFFPGAGAGASGHAYASQVSTNTKQVLKACGTVNTKGVSPTPNSGNPFTSTNLICHSGGLIAYGNHSITYANPPASYIAAGRQLFAQTCSSCHGNEANGVGPDGQATIGPNLQGVGAATVDFWVSSGRMPAADVKAVEAERRPTRLTPKQALELAAWVNSLDPAVPAVPYPHLQGANQSVGASLFSLNCAACHTITGAGDALAYGTNAPSLQNRQITPQQVVEAIRTGPANMPRFSGNLSDAQVRDITSYVTGRLQHPTNPGGFGLGGVGPVAEGFVALLIGVGGLALICFWIGERS